MLLLDEPLGALDLKLRRAMQLELKQIQRDVGITFVFVTHDQEEALTMSDRIAVFRDGRIEQVATPGRPLRAARRRRSSPASSAPPTCWRARRLVRSWAARVSSASAPRRSTSATRSRDGDATAPGVVQDVVYLGSVNHYLVELAAGPTLTVLRQNLRGTTDEAMALRGQRVTVGWAPEHVIELDGHGPQQQHREQHELEES